ncbi:MAG: heavy-metal-associated domain-containing protein [Clostridiales bacterium]|nr:heavy-metal-associated domain-containing protein [Clostridiales bacterium]
MKKTIKVNNLDCANCAAKAEKAIGKLDGVNSASVNFLMQKITLDVDDNKVDDVLNAVKKTCKKVVPEMDIVKVI